MAFKVGMSLAEFEESSPIVLMARLRAQKHKEDREEKMWAILQVNILNRLRQSKKDKTIRLSDILPSENEKETFDTAEEFMAAMKQEDRERRIRAGDL